jgi:hypothetical protein
MRKRLADVRKGEKVLIQHLGLDLSQAWDHIDRLLQAPLAMDDVRYEVLLITDDPASLETRDQEVAGWCDTVKRMLPKLKLELSAAVLRLKREKRKLDYEIRKYTAFPSVHGFRLKHQDIKACYVAFCRWDENGVEKPFDKLGWGEPRYHRIVGEHVDASQADLVHIFEGHFGHLWEHSGRRSPAQVGYTVPECAEGVTPPKG